LSLIEAVAVSSWKSTPVRESINPHSVYLPVLRSPKNMQDYQLKIGNCCLLYFFFQVAEGLRSNSGSDLEGFHVEKCMLFPVDVEESNTCSMAESENEQNNESIGNRTDCIMLLYKLNGESVGG